MERIRIITDSASDITQYDPAALTVLPLTIRFGTQEYKDGVNLSHSEFYEKLIESDALPTTSLVSPGDFEDAFRQAIANGEKVVAITISSKLSGTYQSAFLAATNVNEDYDEPQVYVVDSLLASISEQIVVQYALSLRNEEGMTAEKLSEILNRDKKKAHLLGVPSTLEYLKKGGRISPSVALIGGVLSIRPVLALNNGEITVLGTARGSRAGNNYLIKEIENSEGVDFSKPCCVGYTGLDDSVLKKYMKDSERIYKDHLEELTVSTVGGTIGTHVGPGAIIVAFFTK